MDSTPPPFSSSEAFRYGWGVTKKQVPLFLGMMLVVAVAWLFLQGLRQAAGGHTAFGALVALLSWIVEGAMAIGWIRIALRLHDGRPATVRDLIPDSTTLLAYLATALLYGLIVGVGLALLIVPGIYLAVRLSPYGFVVVDEKAHPWFALRRASALTEHVRWRLLGFGLLLFLINLLGAVLFGVGLVITMPVSAMATAHVFRRLQARAVERPPAPAHPAPLPT